jgi:hypothetical protein
MTDPSEMSDDELLEQINHHDPYDVEFARRFRDLRARLEEAEAAAAIAARMKGSDHD